MLNHSPFTLHPTSYSRSRRAWGPPQRSLSCNAYFTPYTGACRDAGARPGPPQPSPSSAPPASSSLRAGAAAAGRLGGPGGPSARGSGMAPAAGGGPPEGTGPPRGAGGGGGGGSGFHPPLTRAICTPCYRAPEVVMSRRAQGSEWLAWRSQFCAPDLYSFHSTCAPPAVWRCWF
jgi:hypothetical protein